MRYSCDFTMQRTSMSGAVFNEQLSFNPSALSMCLWSSIVDSNRSFPCRSCAVFVMLFLRPQSCCRATFSWQRLTPSERCRCSLPSTTISDAFIVFFDEEYRRSGYGRFSRILYDSVNVYTHKQPWDVFMSMLNGLCCIYVCVKTVRGNLVCHSARLMCQLWVESTVCIIRN